VGIHRLLHSSCCLLNTNTAITRQLTGTARTLEAEWWQVCWEAWVREQRKMSQVLGRFGLLDFTTLWPVLAWRAFLNLWTVYFFNFPNFFSGHGQPRILNPQIWRSTCICTTEMCMWQWSLRAMIHIHTHTQIIIFTYVTRICKYDEH